MTNDLPMAAICPRATHQALQTQVSTIVEVTQRVAAVDGGLNEENISNTRLWQTITLQIEQQAATIRSLSRIANGLGALLPLAHQMETKNSIAVEVIDFGCRQEVHGELRMIAQQDTCYQRDKNKQPCMCCYPPHCLSKSIVAIGSWAWKTALPATRISAPASQSSEAFLVFTPPSTSMRVFKPRLSIASRK